MSVKSSNLRLLDYTDFRVYLKDYYAAMKVSAPYFSYRFFSKQAGFSSPNFLKLVMEGKRNLSAEGIEKFIKALKLKADEARHFRLLVQRTQATLPEEKDYYTRQLFKSRVYRQLKPLSLIQYEYFSAWYHLPLRELVLRADFINDAKWIAAQFTPPLTESQAKAGMATLEKLELIECDANGRYHQKQGVISTGDDVSGDAIKNYHREMIGKGAEAIERFPNEVRDISSLTVGVSRKNAERMRKMLREFRKELLAITQEDQSVDEVLQVNFQLFPLTQNKPDGDSK